MGWGTTYKHEGYLNRIYKSQIESKLRECDDNLRSLWNQITIYMAQTPPAWEDTEYGKRPYAAFLEELIEEIREEMEENIILRYKLQECQEAMDENPENVKDDNDE